MSEHEEAVVGNVTTTILQAAQIIEAGGVPRSAVLQALDRVRTQLELMVPANDDAPGAA
jgi:hypothetical protein